MTKSVIELDLRGLKCPLPVLRLRKVLRKMAAGETIEVACTDPLAAIDIPHLVQTQGDHLISQTVEGGVSIFVITKA